MGLAVKLLVPPDSLSSPFLFHFLKLLRGSTQVVILVNLDKKEKRNVQLVGAILVAIVELVASASCTCVENA